MAHVTFNKKEMIDAEILTKAREKYREFISSSRVNGHSFLFTANSEPSPYARCFAVFGYHLLREDLSNQADMLAEHIQTDLNLLRKTKMQDSVDILYDKPYLQLLTFSLSSLFLLNKLGEFSLQDHIEPLLKRIQIEKYLKMVGALKGKPGSGNFAMFVAILLIYGKRMGLNTPLIEEWEDLHIRSTNATGFWGTGDMSHLKFQNGYHQYEIFEYNECDRIDWELVARNVASLVDDEGHFAPYPGGGGCYDYDAIFILTSKHHIAKNYIHVLERSVRSILDSQNLDGGFCESVNVRPRNIKNLGKFLKHIRDGNTFSVRKERLRRAVTLQRIKHDRIHTHWSKYSRKWSESNLWDSWFRMLAIARVITAIDDNHHKQWGFIDFPGIGYNRDAFEVR